jgi:hypothetical protein
VERDLSYSPSILHEFGARTRVPPLGSAVFEFLRTAGSTFEFEDAVAEITDASVLVALTAKAEELHTLEETVARLHELSGKAFVDHGSLYRSPHISQDSLDHVTDALSQTGLANVGSANTDLVN